MRQVGDLGIGSIAGIFTEFGYKQMDELAFPAKKLRATWLQPPSYASGLPRVFISELKVGRWACYLLPMMVLSVIDPTACRHGLLELDSLTLLSQAWGKRTMHCKR